jgi:hypothetical protein
MSRSGTSRVCCVAVVDDWPDGGHEDCECKGASSASEDDIAVCRPSEVTLRLSPLAAHTLRVAPLQCCQVTRDV